MQRCNACWEQLSNNMNYHLVCLRLPKQHTRGTFRSQMACALSAWHWFLDAEVASAEFWKEEMQASQTMIILASKDMPQRAWTFLGCRTILQIERSDRSHIIPLRWVFTAHPFDIDTDSLPVSTGSVLLSLNSLIPQTISLKCPNIARGSLMCQSNMQVIIEL